MKLPASQGRTASPTTCRNWRFSPGSSGIPPSVFTDGIRTMLPSLRTPGLSVQRPRNRRFQAAVEKKKAATFVAAFSISFQEEAKYGPAVTFILWLLFQPLFQSLFDLRPLMIQ